MENKLAWIQSKLKAPKNQYNSFGKYSYRSCEDILEALKPLLAEQDAAIIIDDEIVCIGNRYYVKATARLADKGNVWSVTAYAREPESRKGMDEAQVTGATSSYARKYALNGLFAIDDTKDPDVTNKHGQNGNTEPPPPKQPQKEDKKKKGRFGFLAAMADFKKALGIEQYYHILGDHGFEKSNQIEDRDTQEKVYRAMRDAVNGGSDESVL